MIEVAQNQENIPFHNQSRINLSLLKSQIDLKFLRISRMVHYLPNKDDCSFQEPYYCIRPTEDKGIQTDTLANQLNFSSTSAQSQILAPSKINYINVIQQKDLKGENQSINIRNIINKVQKQFMSKLPITKKISASSQFKQNIQNYLAPIIESNTYTFRQMKQTGRASLPKKKITHYDQIFNSVKYGHQLSNVQICKSQTDEDQFSKFRTSKQKKDSSRKQNIVSPFIDFSGSEAMRSDSSRPWMWKIQPAPLCQKRILVSQQCKQKMHEQVNEFIHHKRKQVDSQIRANILKKIEEKYGEECII